MPPTMRKPPVAVAREAAPPRTERAYGDQDVRKALRFMLAHVEKGVAPPTAWAVSRMQQFMPAMYEPVRAGPSCTPWPPCTPVDRLPPRAPARPPPSRAPRPLCTAQAGVGGAREAGPGRAARLDRRLRPGAEGWRAGRAQSLHRGVIRLSRRLTETGSVSVRRLTETGPVSVRRGPRLTEARSRPQLRWILASTETLWVDLPLWVGHSDLPTRV